MKKILVCLLMAVTAFSFGAQAQAQGKVAKLKERVQKELNIDEAKADSVVTIVQKFMTSSKELRSNTALTDAQKQESLKSLRQQEAARLKMHLDTKQIAKLKEVVQSFRAKQKGKKAADTDSTDGKK